ncbi:MAG: CGNR zinc finger domain-containing protein [Acidimicrobiales bacterium]
MRSVDELVGGGAPIIGEPLPIELANTRYAVRGQPRDGLLTPEHLATWLRDCRGKPRTILGDADLLGVTGSDLGVARQLRDAVHEILAAVVSGNEPPQRAVAALNRVARSVPRWPQLRWGEPPQSDSDARSRPVAAALAEIAGAAIDLVTGPHRSLIRACRAPGCVLFFIQSHPRRTWCSEGCGNRARVARYQARRLLEG